MADATSTGPAVVTLSVPAQSAYVSVLRTTAAGLAARLDFTVDDIEDLRIAVGEASALLLPHAVPGAALAASFALEPGRLALALSVEARDALVVDTDSFAWQVLSTLATSCDVSTEGSTTTVTLAVHSALLG